MSTLASLNGRAVKLCWCACAHAPSPHTSPHIASSLTSETYDSAYLVLPFSEAQSPQLLGSVFSALAPSASVVVENAGAAAVSADAAELEALGKKVKAELLIAGFSNLSLEGSRVQGTKPASSAGADGAAASLPLRRKIGLASSNGNGNGAALSFGNGASKASKKALWATTPSTADGSGLIDAESLLTAEDKINPNAVRGTDCPPVQPGFSAANGGLKRKKACKGCTCGLRELQEAEIEQEEAQRATGEIVQLDEDGLQADMPSSSIKQSKADDGSGVVRKEIIQTVIGADGKEKKVKRIHVETKGATSSCGSCFLGDAFRCSSCPYLGEFMLETTIRFERYADACEHFIPQASLLSSRARRWRFPRAWTTTSRLFPHLPLMRSF